jgi:DNA-binding transcriptional ArsR family regulator
VSSEVIELDGVTIDALASGTRRNILKKIQGKPMTVSELARELVINKSAIFTHLIILQKADLIIKRDNDNEFVYYELTNKGKNIIGRDENIRIVIYLATSGFVFIAGLYMILLSVGNSFSPKYWTSLPVDIPLLLTGSVLIFSALFILFIGLRKGQE